MAKKKLKETKKKKFLWSIFFMALTSVLSVYTLTYDIGMILPAMAVFLSLFTLVLIGYERTIGKLGTGKFLWSIFFAAFTLAITIYVAGLTEYAPLASLAAFSSATGLALLCREKYKA